MKEETEAQRSYINISMIPQQASGETKISNLGLSDSRTQPSNHPVMPLGSWETDTKEIADV